MRKLYALLAGLLLTLVLPARTPSPDIANFTFQVDHPTKNVVFTNTSTLGSEPGDRKAFWTFGDGSGTITPPLQGTQHHYQLPGTYTVCLKIFRYFPNHNDSVLTAQVCKTVVINTVCQADFIKLPPVDTNNPLRASFKAQPWHNGEKRPARICWTFGDGTDTCIQYSNTNPGPYNVHHTYAHPGIYEVCVNILYQGGCEARKCKEIRMEAPDTCHANFERIPSPLNNPLLVYLKAIPQHNNNRKPARICWTFGDNRDTCINYPENYTGLYAVSHRYEHPGAYEVCVRIIYYGGCEARKCETIHVAEQDRCEANFERIPSNNNPLLVYFRALPQHNNNRKPARICWTFGDNRDTCINYPENYTGQYVVSHRYEHPGAYEVCVRILYYGGCEARKCAIIHVTEADRCEADFERLPLQENNPLSVHFKALPGHNNNRKPARICWQFGDGRDTCINYPENYSGLYTVGHRYNHPGEYEVCVKIFYYGGCDARKCRNIVVPPVTSCNVHLFEITPSITSLVRGFFAWPASTPPRRPVRVCWVFGDGEDTCIMINPNQPVPLLLIRHTYPAPGVYRACVRILFDGGCIAEDCHEVVIRPLSDICGGYMRDSMTGPRTFKFKGFSINNPNDEALSYTWNFGDGSTASGREVTHSYDHGGNYNVCLLIRTRLGCETRICKTLRIPGNNQPALHLSPNPVENILHAEFFSTHTEQVSIKILNSSGVVLRTYQRSVTVGANSWNFDVASLVPGVYSFVLQSPNQLASAIFIKQ
ncbi:MAG: PKD domain-containing protein [Chitinophagaceae bacterium]